MKRYLIILIVCAIGWSSCADQADRSQIANNASADHVISDYVWTKVIDSAAWKKSYNFQMITWHDTLWVFHTDGNWFSVDGVNWAKSTLPNAISNLAFLDYIPFNNAIYGLGYFNGNIERFELRPDIYKTTNLRTWMTVSKNSNLPQRFFYHPFVFDNKIWIIGGEDK